MTLVIKKPTGAKLVLAKDQVRSVVSDVDATRYIQAVEAADGQRLEASVCTAINNFVLGCKSDGIWNAIKASCILAGARTLAGALVPLVGTAPANFNFVSSDYNRKTGLVGDGSTKYLDSNRNNSVDPLNTCHLAIFSTVLASSSTHAYIGAGANPASYILSNSGTFATGLNTATLSVVTSVGNSTGFMGVTRTSSSAGSNRVRQTNYTYSASSTSRNNANHFIFCRNVSTPANYYNGRLAFYSIGESLDLALLDARVTDLINTFGAAIP